MTGDPLLDWITCIPAYSQCPDSSVQVNGAIVIGDLPPQS
jgi:hypothetical protein